MINLNCAMNKVEEKLKKVLKVSIFDIYLRAQDDITSCDIIFPKSPLFSFVMLFSAD